MGLKDENLDVLGAMAQPTAPIKESVLDPPDQPIG